VIEKERGTVRSVYGSHQTNRVFQTLARHPRLIEPAVELLNHSVYIYQFKINAKAAFSGDVWDWHQDYIFWKKEDGMPTNRVTNVAIFLDAVTEFNGPLFFLPGSHKEGMIDSSAQAQLAVRYVSRQPAYKHSPAWISNLTADLKYSLPRECVAALVEKYGLHSVKAPAGSALFFDSNIVHGSTNNISPFDRVVIILTLNSTDNVPHSNGTPRPDFLVCRDSSPVTPVSDDALLRQPLEPSDNIA
jgi:ectoine hydroxylase